MKSSTPPLICSIALAAMAAAGTSHWWSVRQMVVSSTLAIQPSTPAISPAVAPANSSIAPQSPVPQGNESIAQHADSDSSAREEFFQSLIGEIRELRNQNRDLRDQIAETNRDIMKLEFRVDTHSESFRPLPVSEDRFDTTFEADAGILPPRAIPMDLPQDP